MKSLTDLSKAFNAGRTIPIKIQLTDASGNNISSASIDLTAIRLKRYNAENGTWTEVTLQDAGASNPDNLFRYDAALGGYIFNLSTKGLTAGTYAFFWMATRRSTSWASGSCNGLDELSSVDWGGSRGVVPVARPNAR